VLGKLIVILEALGTCNVNEMAKVVCYLKYGFEDV
jgi:hypothetical protein